jgi:hypothetical protein
MYGLLVVIIMSLVIIITDDKLASCIKLVFFLSTIQTTSAS